MKEKNIFENLKQMLLAAVMLSATSVFAVNGVQTVEQVSGTVTLDKDVDYVITAADPFTDGAVLDITNTENAVVIFQNLKPSKAAAHLSHIRINGAKAVKNINCMLKIYAEGCILLPHGTDIKPLTVYTEPDFTGDSESFAVSTRQSLRGHALNNRIQSFTLKRGYMVWFGTRVNNNDPGYNRIFIADKSDIQVELPAILSKSISTLRVSQWNDASKKGFCSWQQTPNEQLNTTWHYNWDAGHNPSDDREYVTQWHHIGWPGISDVGNQGTSANILGNNEPDNTGDSREHPATVDEVLALWPEMMATGRRLGSPAVAGDYNWLYRFMDSIDARGWRCDYVVMHCYWYNDWPSWNSQLSGVRNRTGRPIWITEMNYGANWTGWPGSNREGNSANYAIHLQHFAPIIDGLESTSWLERYCVYNAVEDCRCVIDGKGNLTPSGQYYANKKSNMAYNSTYNVVPKLPKMRDPGSFTIDFDKETHTAVLQWEEYNGEYNQSMTVERQVGDQWEVLAQIELKEQAASYTFTDTEAYNGSKYLIHVVDASGKSRKTRTLQAVASGLEVGDQLQADGKDWYVGGNVVPNGDFDLGTLGWTNGLGQSLTSEAFSVVAAGSIDGGEFLRSWKADNSSSNANALKTTFDILPNRNYYFSVAVRNSESANHILSLSKDGTTETSRLLMLEVAPTWASQAFTFNSGEFEKVIFGARRMGAKSVFDKFSISALFETREEAFANGVACMRTRAELAVKYLAAHPELAAELQALLASVNTTDEAAYLSLKSAVDTALEAVRCKSQLLGWAESVSQIVKLGIPGYEEVQKAFQSALHAEGAADYIQAAEAVRIFCEEYLPMVYAADYIQCPDFKNTTGWETKVGTYTAGDQRLNTIAGKTCWNAWWSGISASKGLSSTMEIRQEVKGLTHGLYALECKAATQFGCLSDQHAYLVYGKDTVTSAALSYEFMDVTAIPDSLVWETLTTSYIYVPDEGTVTVGFVGSKQGAVDGAWRPYANPSGNRDKREGWWCATDFVLRFHPLYLCEVDASGWGAICLPYQFVPAPGVRIYQIAGLSADFKSLCLEEVTETQAGTPYIYYTTEQRVFFYERGEAVARANTVNSLRGNFVVTSRVPAKSYALINGVWQRITSSDRPLMDDYSAIIRTVEELPVLDSWAGTMMPIEGAAEEFPDGIGGVEADNSATADIYTIDGRRTTGSQTEGIYIEVKKDGSVRKRLR